MINKFLITKDQTVKKAMHLINKNLQRCLVVVDGFNKMLGTLSDGDIRNALLKNSNMNDKIEKFYNKKAKFVYKNNYSKDNLKKLFEENGYYVVKSLVSIEMISRIFQQIDQLLDEALQLRKVDTSIFQSVDGKYMYLKKRFPKIKSHVYDLIKHLDGVRAVSTIPTLLQIIKKLTNSSLL